MNGQINQLTQAMVTMMMMRMGMGVMSPVMLQKAKPTIGGKAEKGEYYIDYDEKSGLWCVFHTDTGHRAYSSFSSRGDALDDAAARNIQPKAISAMIIKAISDETYAVAKYEFWTKTARELGDVKTAELFEHIAGEEKHHISELEDRHDVLSELSY